MTGALAVTADLDETLARAQDGDPAAFATFVRHHQAMVFSLALHALRSRPAAEDLAQEVFVELYRNLARLESERSDSAKATRRETDRAGLKVVKV